MTDDARNTTAAGEGYRVIVLGVPNSVSAYCVGVEDAPAAMRKAGLLGALASGGTEVVDAGDLTRRVWHPDPSSPFVQNVGEEAQASMELANAAAALLADGRRLLVIGGSCMVAFGMCRAMAIADARPRLIYIDRHLDLNTPRSTTEGSLSWMGMAHALGLEGAASELVSTGAGAPILRPSDLVYLGADPDRAATAWEREHLDLLNIHVVDQAALCADPTAAARRAKAYLGDGPFVVHLDVDVLDFLDAPIAENVNGRNSGPTIEMVGVALSDLLRREDCWGLSIGQLVPAHAVSDPTALPRLVSALGAALAQDGTPSQ